MATRSNERQYIGHGKRVRDYDLVNASICLSDIPTGTIFEYKGKQYIKIVVGGKKEPDRFGKTHSIWIDPWKPDPNYKAKLDSGRESRPLLDDSNIDDLPF